MTKSTDCLKCGVSILEYDLDGHVISESLCSNCLNVWIKFHREYGQEISKEHRHGVNGHHAGWSVFLGELPNLWDKHVERIKKKERVQFT